MLIKFAIIVVCVLVGLGLMAAVSGINGTDAEDDQ